MRNDQQFSVLADLLGRMAEALERLGERNNGAWDVPETPVLRWDGTSGRLCAVPRPNLPALDELLELERQRDALLATVRAFAGGRPANHALLTGARGTGKSSLVRAVFATVHREQPSLRLAGIAPGDLQSVTGLLDRLAERTERFIVFCDDLTFSEADAGFHGLKGVLEGSAMTQADNVLFIVTSNRRHLVPETVADQTGTRIIDGDLHESEAIEDKLAFADRFGLWLSFPPFNQATYLRLVEHWRRRLAPQLAPGPALERAALQFARRRGTRSGRTAKQFILAALAGVQGVDGKDSEAT